MEKESKREQLLSLLGEMPERHRVEAYTLKVEDRESYVIETLILSIHGVEEVPAYFVKPKDTVKKTSCAVSALSWRELRRWEGRAHQGCSLFASAFICERVHLKRL